MKALLRNGLLAGLVLSGGAAHAYSTADGTIYDNADQPVQLRGVNWFGFEGQDHVAHGLWTRNWKDMIAQMDSLVLLCQIRCNGMPGGLMP
jgi:endoglucanase